MDAADGPPIARAATGVLDCARDLYTMRLRCRPCALRWPRPSSLFMDVGESVRSTVGDELAERTEPASPVARRPVSSGGSSPGRLCGDSNGACPASGVMKSAWKLEPSSSSYGEKLRSVKPVRSVFSPPDMVVWGGGALSARCDAEMAKFRK